jgi:hypothetical protein
MEGFMYKLVQLNEVVVDYAEDKELREFFSEVLALRLKGYRASYGNLSVPLDQFDLIGNHLVIAKITEDKLQPIACVRSVTQDQAQKYGQELPFLEHMFPDSGSKLRLSCENFIKEHSNVCYTNNYTVDMSLSEEQKQFLGMIAGSFYYNYHSDHDIKNFITATSDKFKVYRTRTLFGYDYMNDDTEFSTFTAEHIMGEKFRAMKMTEFSDWCKAMGEKFQSMYDDRIVLGTQIKTDIKKAA